MNPYTLYPELPYASELAQYRKDSNRSEEDRRARRREKCGLAVTRPWSLMLAMGMTCLAASQIYV